MPVPASGTQPLFSEGTQGNTLPKRELEPAYAYLNSSARAPFANVRHVLNAWYERSPEFQTRQWYKRFVSRSDTEHVGALFELFCKALLEAHGWATEHESESGGVRRTRPEFIVKSGTTEFVFECTTSWGGTRRVQQEKRIQQVLDFVSRIPINDHYLTIEVVRVGAPTSMSGLRDTVFRSVASCAANPSLTEPGWLPWEAEGWVIRVFATQSPGLASTVGRTIINYVGPGTWDDSPVHLWQSLKGKASRYELQDRPYVVAVAFNAESGSAEGHHRALVDALFGSRRWLVGPGSGDIEEVREPDGFWRRHKRVSAVLLASHLHAHTIVSDESPVRLYHNPWASVPLPESLWQGDQVILRSDQQLLEVRPGRRMRELFNLPEGWPFWDQDNVE